jgi:hypothetical protein
MALPLGRRQYVVKPPAGHGRAGARRVVVARGGDAGTEAEA